MIRGCYGERATVPPPRPPVRVEQECIAGILELLIDDNPAIAAAAETALECVCERGADPRLMLLVLEAAQQGTFEPRRCFDNP